MSEHDTPVVAGKDGNAVERHYRLVVTWKEVELMASGDERTGEVYLVGKNDRMNVR